MTGRRKLALAVCASLMAVTLTLWLRPRGPTYEGRTVEQWFKRYDEMRNKSYYDAVRAIPVPQRKAIALGEITSAENAFTKMGTNAVPYLADLITQDWTYSSFELWRIKVRGRMPQTLKRFLPLPKSRTQSGTAANLLSSQIKPPGELLLPLIEPALQSTNAEKRHDALIALRGIRSGHTSSKDSMTPTARCNASRPMLCAGLDRMGSGPSAICCSSPAAPTRTHSKLPCTP